MRRAPRNIMSTGAYHVMAEGVRRIADPVLRKQMADHFATFLNARSTSFDNNAWFHATGGIASIVQQKKTGDT